MRALIRLFVGFPFTLVGILSFTIFFIGAYSDSIPLANVTRILVIPAWLARMGVVALGILLFPASPPGWYWVIAAPLHLAPFVLLDLAIARTARYGIGRFDGTHA